MPSIVQLAGGPRVLQDQYTGAARELTAVTDSKELRLHDGVTLGGIRFLNISQNDARYHLQNDELNGIIDLAVQETLGLVTRIGNGSYRTRALVAVAANLVITDGNTRGKTGDIEIGLKPIISSDHEFSGIIDFTHVDGITALKFTGALIGNLTGNSTGTHSGPVTGDVTGNLSGDANGNHTGTFTGAVDVRGVALLLDDGQIPLVKVNGAISAAHEGLNQAGMVQFWYGLISNIPSGYVLCDGNNSTPNLIDRMVIGAGGIYTEDDVGGTLTHDHGGTITITAAGSHTHTITVNGTALTIANMPAHEHQGGAVADNNTCAAAGINVTAKSSVGGGNLDTRGQTTGYVYDTESAGSGTAHGHAGSANSDGSHTHTNVLASSSHLPPYYALAYIMKT